MGVSSIFCSTYSIPIEFPSYSKLPVIKVVIEDIEYSFEVDTGATGEIIINQEVLNLIHKKKYIGIIKTVDINGNICEEPKFVIPNIKIGEVDFKEVTARQENSLLSIKGSIVRPSLKNEDKKNAIRLAKIAGKIGWGLFKKHRWYFDFSHSLLWIVDDLEELKKEVKYFSIYDYIEVPIEMDDAGIVILVDTQVGTKKIVLDTGANVSCIRESLVPKKFAKEFEPGRWMFLSKVVIGGVHFENYPFFLYDFTPLFHVDGILSIHFFERNGIYLDFEHRRALIGPAQFPFWPRLVNRVQSFWAWLTF